MKRGNGFLVSYLRTEQRRLASVAGVLVVSQVVPLAGPLLIRSFVDDARAGAGVVTLLAIAGGYLFVALASQGLGVMATWLGTALAWRVCDRIRADVGAHVLGLDYAWLSRRTPGELIQRVDDDITGMSEFYSQVVLQAVAGLILLIGVVAVVWSQSWEAGVVLAAFVAVAGVVMHRAQAAAVPAGVVDRQATAELLGTIEERLAGLEDLRANGGGAHSMRRFNESSARAYRIKVRAELAAGTALTAVYLTFALGTAALLAVGVLLYRRHQVSLGTLFLLFQSMQLVRISLQKTADQLRNVQKAGGGAGRLRELLSLRSGNQTGTEGGPIPHPAEVRFEHVTFRYDDGVAALRDVDFTVPAGTVLGVVGRTGAGKTTVARLLARLYDAQEGSVAVGGIDVRRMRPEVLRSAVGLVTQDVQLFHASVRDNLTLFEPGVPDARLLEVVEELDLGRWLDGLADGLDALIGEGEAGLSAGEAQLLALGRVLLRDPAVVVLDEASSRLDAVTEARIDRAIGRLISGRTAVVIAHRLATLERADAVIVVDGGRVVEAGERAALAAERDSAFSQLLASQLELAP